MTIIIHTYIHTCMHTYIGSRLSAMIIAIENDYCDRKWNNLPDFKTWMRLFIFQYMPMHLGKA